MLLVLNPKTESQPGWRTKVLKVWLRKILSHCEFYSSISPSLPLDIHDQNDISCLLSGCDSPGIPLLTQQFPLPPVISTLPPSHLGPKTPPSTAYQLAPVLTNCLAVSIGDCLVPILAKRDNPLPLSFTNTRMILLFHPTFKLKQVLCLSGFRAF